MIKNQGIGNTLVWVLSNIWILRQVRCHKFGANVSNKMLLNAVKCQGYRFYCFWVIKGKSTGGGNTFPPPRLGLKECNLTNVSVHFFFSLQSFLNLLSINKLNTLNSKLSKFCDKDDKKYCLKETNQILEIKFHQSRLDFNLLEFLLIVTNSNTFSCCLWYSELQLPILRLVSLSVVDQIFDLKQEA